MDGCPPCVAEEIAQEMFPDSEEEALISDQLGVNTTPNLNKVVDSEVNANHKESKGDCGQNRKEDGNDGGLHVVGDGFKVIIEYEEVKEVAVDEVIGGKIRGLEEDNRNGAEKQVKEAVEDGDDADKENEDGASSVATG